MVEFQYKNGESAVSTFRTLPAFGFLSMGVCERSCWIMLCFMYNGKAQKGYLDFCDQESESGKWNYIYLYYYYEVMELNRKKKTTRIFLKSLRMFPSFLNERLWSNSLLKLINTSAQRKHWFLGSILLEKLVYSYKKVANNVFISPREDTFLQLQKQITNQNELLFHDLLSLSKNKYCANEVLLYNTNARL